ncbi:hypothetical protein T4B_186 [Trichinella pseudospiralis]|uniref:PiggyBac transposable element-derived protein domain-containing protein n=1 Tax=Trichinella pseudospiralis TaxID=6337 RepID=A0A0V1IDX8_TRIPS|nr:hypothetical protein T4B_186 [Trichinella pseudospiralis]KRZ41684.1 hypothetical protein T4C_5840 [Trichinella pseudospiralis]
MSEHGISKSLPKMCKQEHINIYSGRQRPRSLARLARMPFEIWWLFTTKAIIDVITLNPKIYIRKIRAQYIRERRAKDTDEDEIKALLGLLLLTGIFRSSRLNLCNFSNIDGTSVEIFSSKMSLQRLRFLLRCMRFDDHATRSGRKLQDKLIIGCATNFLSHCFFN